MVEVNNFKAKKGNLREVEKEIYKDIKLPKYIEVSLKMFGNTVISDKIYKKIGNIGVKELVKKQFMLNCKVDVESNENAIITLIKGNEFIENEEINNGRI